MKSIRIMFAIVMLLLTQLVYAGEFDGHCATGLTGGMLIKTKCEINTLFESKTYCFASQASKEKFLEAPSEMVKKAAEFYAKNSEPVREKNQSDRCDQSDQK